MGYERLFLCADSTKPTEVKYAPKTETVPLLLWGRNPNITLKISDITRRMVANLPELYTDLLEIATYVYCADQATPRGGSGVRDVGAKWRRNMHFVIPVRKPDFWCGQQVTEALVETLGFLSDDNYDFRFSKLRNPPSVESYLEFPEADVGFMADEVVPFSGGLDSLAGAIQEIFVDQHRVALVSHRSAPKIAPKQQRLHAAICGQCRSDLRPLHVPVWIHKHGLRASDDSQRSRSFLYASLAATVATMFGRDRIRFYENGITSLNLPVAEQVIGARATRTTHPKSIAGFQRLFSLMSDGEFTVETPFIWKTKTDVVELIKDAGKADLAKHAVSCSRIFAMTKLHTHCGCCSQCIDRRLAVFAADCVEHDPDEMYKIDVFIGQRKKGQDITLAESYIRSMKEIADMTAIQLFHKYGDLSRVIPFLPGHSDKNAEKIFELYMRNAEQAQRAITNALRYYAEDVAKGLPDRCLFSQLFGTKIPEGQTVEAAAPEEGKGPKKRRPTAAEMRNRNQVISLFVGNFKREHDRLPTVDEVMTETKYGRKQIYETDAYKEGRIAKKFAKSVTEMAGGSVTQSERFSGASEQHSRADRRSKSEQAELDALIDQQREDNHSDFVK